MFVILVPCAHVRVRERGVACHPNDTEFCHHTAFTVSGEQKSLWLVVIGMRYSVGTGLGEDSKKGTCLVRDDEARASARHQP